MENAIGALYLLLGGTSAPSLAFTSIGENDTELHLARKVSFLSESPSQSNLHLSRQLTFISSASSSAYLNLESQTSLGNFTSLSSSVTNLFLARNLTVISTADSRTQLSLVTPLLLGAVSVGESVTSAALSRQLTFLSGASSETELGLANEAQFSFTSVATSETFFSLGRNLEFLSKGNVTTNLSFLIVTPGVSRLNSLKVNQPPRSLSPWLVNSIWANIVGATDQLQGFVQATSTSVQAEGSSLVPLTWTVQTDYASFMTSNPTDGSVQYFFPSEPGFYRFQVKSLATNSASGNSATLSILKNGVGNPVDASVSGGSLQSLSGEMVYYLNGKTDKVWISLQSTSTGITFTTTLQVEPLYLGAKP